MLAPYNEDDPERIWPRPWSRRRLWRNRGLLAAAWAIGLLSAWLIAWNSVRVLLR